MYLRVFFVFFILCNFQVDGASLKHLTKARQAVKGSIRHVTQIVHSNAASHKTVPVEKRIEIDSRVHPSSKAAATTTTVQDGLPVVITPTEHVVIQQPASVLSFPIRQLQRPVILSSRGAGSRSDVEFKNAPIIEEYDAPSSSPYNNQMFDGYNDESSHRGRVRISNKPRTVVLTRGGEYSTPAYADDVYAEPYASRERIVSVKVSCTIRPCPRDEQKEYDGEDPSTPTEEEEEEEAPVDDEQLTGLLRAHALTIQQRLMRLLGGGGGEGNTALNPGYPLPGNMDIATHSITTRIPRNPSASNNRGEEESKEEDDDEDENKGDEGEEAANNVVSARHKLVRELHRRVMCAHPPCQIDIQETITVQDQPSTPVAAHA